jgi:hypothetical protein
MIHHIFNSEFSYLKHAKNCFEKSELNSAWYILTEKEVSGIPAGSVNIRINTKDYSDFLESFKDTDLILFHSLLSTNSHVAWDIIKNNKCLSKKAWVLYGSEITFLDLNPDSYHDKKTRWLYYKQKPIRLSLPLIRLWNRLSKKSFQKLLNRMDYVAHFMQEEVALLEQKSGIKKPLLFHIYALLEDFVGHEFLNQRVKNTGAVLIGNSGSYTSNHIEIIDQLAKHGFSNNVLVPLNYGNVPYADYISAYGTKQLGDHFKPIREYLPLNEYTQLLLSCSCVIMNHYRQQAMGNIITQLYLGSRVYLNDFTSSYQYLKRLDLNVYSLQKDMNYADPACYMALSDEETTQNQRILMQEYGKETVISKLRDSFSRF